MRDSIAQQGLTFEERAYLTKQSRAAFNTVRDPHGTDPVRHAILNAMFCQAWQRGHDLATPHWLVWVVVFGFGMLTGTILRGLL